MSNSVKPTGGLATFAGTLSGIRVLEQGTFCTAGVSACEPHDHVIGPAAFGDMTVTKFQDFGREKIVDADGVTVPPQDLYFVTLDNGYTFAARGSGTEPKIKFYLFGNEKAADAATLPAAKAKVRQTLDALKKFIAEDAKRRAES